MYRSAGLLVVTATATALFVAGCADPEPETSTPESSASTAVKPASATKGTFGPYSSSARAVTYDPAVVPPGATAEVTITESDGATVVTLTAQGLLADRVYGAHLHTKPCGETGKAAGPHYQHEHDPAAKASPPSVDPSYANPRNEVWLDLTTDAQGAGTSRSTQEWTFTAKPQSLVIHAKKTETAPGKAGTAGDRVACLTI
ncbi:superoxide dismutase family protein [Cryptosporangium japonicum]|uniref:Superoxide dismutase copper/zinc binding domain-containing protein n=1 Tax=Cryptosporangium japonicum TaxID=80872 RepID=A0ABP3DGV8_9ACTN